MNSFRMFGLVALVLVLALGVYSCTILDQYQEVERAMREERQSAMDALRALPSPEESPATLGGGKFEAWLRTRERVAQVLTEGREEGTIVSGLPLMRLGTAALQELAAALRANDLGFEEYRALQARFRALLAIEDERELRAAWTQRVRVADDREGLPLPPAATDRTDAEKALLASHRDRLVASMPADTLTKLLDAVADG